MSEYWVSHKKYFCKYCEIYITDDAPSKRQHESGLRHKGNRERFVRNLYKQGERRNKDLEEERREMARIEAAANASFARDVSTGNASSSVSSRVSQMQSPAAASKKPERPTSVWSNYSTAQSLGITDPDEERMKAELERRRTQGVVGEWTAVAPPPPPLPADVQPPKEEDTKDGICSDLPPQKREAEAPLEDEEDERHFKLRKRKIGAALGEIWDPGEIPIKLKSKPKEEGTAAPTLSKDTQKHDPAIDSLGPKQASPSPAGAKLQWQPMGWKRATVPADAITAGTDVEAGTQNKSNDADLSIKEEDGPAPLHSETISSQHLGNNVHQEINSLHDKTVSAKSNVKEEEFESPAVPEPVGGLFRKRKVPTAARGKRE